MKAVDAVGGQSVLQKRCSKEKMSHPQKTFCVLSLLTMKKYHFLIKVALSLKFDQAVQLRTLHGATTLVVMALDLEETATM